MVPAAERWIRRADNLQVREGYMNIEVQIEQTRRPQGQSDKDAYFSLLFNNQTTHAAV